MCYVGVARGGAAGTEGKGRQKSRRGGSSTHLLGHHGCASRPGPRHMCGAELTSQIQCHAMLSRHLTRVVLKTTQMFHLKLF